MKPVKMEALHLSPRLSPAQGRVRVLALKKHVPLLDVAFSRAEETRQPAPPIWVSIKCYITFSLINWNNIANFQHLSLYCFCNITPIHELLAVEGERKGTEHLDLAGAQTQKPKAVETLSPEGKKKSKGIMKFLGRSFFFLMSLLIF